MPEKTPWFDGSVKPVRNGPYEVQAKGHEDRTFFSAYRRGQFHGCWSDPDEAIKALSYKGPRCWGEVKSWRGLTKEAK